MTVSQTVRGILVIGAVPAVLVMGAAIPAAAATPAAAQEAGFSKSDACRLGDPAAYGYRRASYEEFRSYYAARCSDGDHAAVVRHDTDVDQADRDKPDRTKVDKEDRDKPVHVKADHEDQGKPAKADKPDKPVRTDKPDKPATADKPDSGKPVDM